MTTGTGTRTDQRRTAALGVLATLGVLVAGLTWAKWLPYAHKVDGLATSRAWEGGALANVAAGAPTWWQGAWDFAVTYTGAVWKALAVALVVGAAVEAFLPRDLLRGLLARRTTWAGAAVAGAASLPSMMCTCCAAPVAHSLRRSGVPAPSVVAYWLGNPVLNPAVVVFLVLVAPWQWAAARVVVGVGVVALAAAAAGRLHRQPVDRVLVVDAPRTDDDGAPAVRFARTFGRSLVTLVPEYAVVVLAVGAAAHLLPWEAGILSAGPLALLVLLAVALLMVVPTGGEIPVLLALAAAGASPWALGVVLVALPAVSLPSMVMVAGALTWRVVAGVAGVVAAGALVAGAVLAVV